MFSPPGGFDELINDVSIISINEEEEDSSALSSTVSSPPATSPFSSDVLPLTGIQVQVKDRSSEKPRPPRPPPPRHSPPPGPGPWALGAARDHGIIEFTCKVNPVASGLECKSPCWKGYTNKKEYLQLTPALTFFKEFNEIGCSSEMLL